MHHLKLDFSKVDGGDVGKDRFENMILRGGRRISISTLT
jgi:hypothetical protein